VTADAAHFQKLERGLFRWSLVTPKESPTPEVVRARLQMLTSLKIPLSFSSELAAVTELIRLLQEKLGEYVSTFEVVSVHLVSGGMTLASSPL
jgi:hypothetical protein